MGSNQGMPNCPWKQIFYLECCFWVECKPKWISKMAILIHHTTTWIISHLSPSILLIRRRSYNLQIHMQMQKTGKWNKWSVPRSFASYTFELNKHYGMCGILLNNWDYKFHQNIQQIVSYIYGNNCPVRSCVCSYALRVSVVLLWDSNNRGKAWTSKLRTKYWKKGKEANKIMNETTSTPKNSLCSTQYMPCHIIYTTDHSYL